MIGRASASFQVQEELPPVNIRPIPIGDPKVRSKIRFEVVTAKVVETAGKKHVVRILRFLSVLISFYPMLHPLYSGLHDHDEKSW